MAIVEELLDRMFQRRTRMSYPMMATTLQDASAAVEKGGKREGGRTSRERIKIRRERAARNFLATVGSRDFRADVINVTAGTILPRIAR